MPSDPSQPSIRSAEVVLPGGDDLDATRRFFTDRLGFRLESIFPADDPLVVVVSGYGVRLRLDRGVNGNGGSLRLHTGETANELLAPNGTRIEFVGVDPPPEAPYVPAFVMCRAGSETDWVVGRAGMRYRDLIPDRQGGRFIASHIRIDDGGPVPDYVHYHDVQFQVIYCYRGWVKVVYEDQGPAFVMHAGDCVLQPPGIRHRVLECSSGLEVIEVGGPADHVTHADHELELPTAAVRPERDFGGQRFVRHVAVEAAWRQEEGFESRRTGIVLATSGRVDVEVQRVADNVKRTAVGELTFAFVLQGTVALHRDDADPERLSSGDSVVLPPGLSYAWTESADLELFVVSVLAELA